MDLNKVISLFQDGAPARPPGIPTDCTGGHGTQMVSTILKTVY